MFIRGSKVVEKQCASGGRLKTISRPGKTKLLLVDDAQMFIELLRMALVQDENIEIVGLANGGAQALRLAAATQPDLVLLDIKMPGVCGLHLIEPLRRKVPAVKIIMLSAFLDPFTVHRVVHSKVEGYVEKSCSLKLLRCAVRRVRSGGSYFSPGFVMLRKDSFKSGQAFHKVLSEREQHILQLMALGLSDDEIGCRYDLMTSTVTTHRKHIRAKLGLHSDRELLAYARRWGLDSKGPANTGCPLAMPFSTCSGN